MIHRNLRYTNGWEWHVLQLQHQPYTASKRGATHSKLKHPVKKIESNNEKLELKRTFPFAADWIDSSEDRLSNHSLLSKVDGYGTIVQGTILIQLSDDNQDVTPFHFWLASNMLITMHHDARIPLRLQNIDYMEQYEACSTAPEAFFIMLGVLLESLHIGLDHFEDRLGQLELNMREHNRKDLLDDIIERRYELLRYSHLYLPIRELEGLAKEAFLESLIETNSYARMQHRFERIDHLLKHYAQEIDTLISVDDALSNFRGNEIIRTLTIFTVICLPATLFGAIWGSNFEWLPFKQEPLGFIYMIATIVLLTGIIYFMLWRRGWTGDILKHRKVKKQQPKLLPTVLSSSEMMKDHPLPSRKHRGKLEKIDTSAATIKITEHAADAPLPSRKQR